MWHYIFILFFLHCMVDCLDNNLVLFIKFQTIFFIILDVINGFNCWQLKRRYHGTWVQMLTGIVFTLHYYSLETYEFPIDYTLFYYHMLWWLKRKYVRSWINHSPMTTLTAWAVDRVSLVTITMSNLINLMSFLYFVRNKNKKIKINKRLSLD